MAQFLEPSARIDIKTLALEQVLGLTGNEEGRKSLEKCDKVLGGLLSLMEDKTNEPSAKDASLAVINLSGDAELAKSLLEKKDLRLVERLWQCVQDKDCYVSDPCCAVLSNLTIDKVCCNLVSDALEAAKITLDQIIFVFCQEGYNSKGAKLHYLGPVLSNLSQLASIRSQILDHSRCVIQRLLPFTEFKQSNIRRGGIIGTLR